MSPIDHTVTILLADATDACVRCGTTDRTSIMEIRPHAVWCCAGCYQAVLYGEPVPAGQ